LEQLDRLVEMITDITGGRYKKDIMELTGPDTQEPVRAIAHLRQRLNVNRLAPARWILKRG
jgi:hypothetical protein